MLSSFRGFGGFGGDFGFSDLLHRGSSSARPWSSTSSSTSEEVYESNGNGHFLARKRRCKNGRCVQVTQRGEAPQLPSEAAKAPRLRQPFGLDGMTSRLFSDAERQMQQQELGMEGLFRRASPLEQMGGRLSSWPLPSHLRRDTKQLGKVPEESSNSSQAVEESSSSSMETQIVNGHLVERRMKCHNGKCKSSVVERDLKRPQPDRDVPVKISLIDRTPSQ